MGVWEGVFVGVWEGVFVDVWVDVWDGVCVDEGVDGSSAPKLAGIGSGGRQAKAFNWLP